MPSWEHDIDEQRPILLALDSDRHKHKGQGPVKHDNRREKEKECASYVSRTSLEDDELRA